MRSPLRPLLFAASLVFVGCGGSVSQAPGGADAEPDVKDTFETGPRTEEEVGGGDAIVIVEDTSTKIETGPRARCPDAPPIDGASCGASALDCGYGDDPRPDCRLRAQCVAGAWQVSKKLCDAPKDASSCPPEVDAVKMSTCAEANTFCHYPTHLCECAGYDPKYLHWYCDPPSRSSGCPLTLPNLGISCSIDGTSCIYGSCGVDTSGARRCSGGVWVDEFPPCGV